jgi:transketolase
MILQRDIFINEIKLKMKKNKNLFFLSADFGSEALDELRKKFPSQFLHCGISEQAMVDMATGLALDKRNVFVYAMAPFLSLRSIEQIKCGPAMMKLPIIFISVGIGIGYADSGPTHYANEDYAVIRTMIGNEIYTPSCNSQTKYIAKKLLKNPKFSYIRLDRNHLPEIKTSKKNNFKDGFAIIGKPKSIKKLLISSGKMSHEGYKIFLKNPDRYYLLDLFKTKPISEKIIKYLKNNSGIIVLDEQNIHGGLASAIFEYLVDKNININSKIKTICLPDKYIYENGGRNFLLNKFVFSRSNNKINK